MSGAGNSPLTPKWTAYTRAERMRIKALRKPRQQVPARVMTLLLV
jgi:hypothetical protein